jgi:hypothetical protein
MADDAGTRRVRFPPVDRERLDRLIELAKNRGPVTAQELGEQRISFAYGNLAIDNPRITREMVIAEHDRTYGREARLPDKNDEDEKKDR